VVGEPLGRSSVVVHVIVNKLFEVCEGVKEFGGVLVSFGVWCGCRICQTLLLHASTNDEKRSSSLHVHHCSKGIYKIVNWKTIHFHPIITTDFVSNTNPFT